MKHKQALADYLALREIAGGEPEDAGELLEQIAEKMLMRPTPENAASLLCELVDLYCRRGLFDTQGCEGICFQRFSSGDMR